MTRTNLFDTLVEVKCRLLNGDPTDATLYFVDKVLKDYQEEARETVPEIAHALTHWRDLTPSEVDTLGPRLWEAWKLEREADQKAFMNLELALRGVPTKIPDLKEFETQVADAKEGA